MDRVKKENFCWNDIHAHVDASLNYDCWKLFWFLYSLDSQIFLLPNSLSRSVKCFVVFWMGKRLYCEVFCSWNEYIRGAHSNFSVAVILVSYNVLYNACHWINEHNSKINVYYAISICIKRAGFHNHKLNSNTVLTLPGVQDWETEEELVNVLLITFSK